MKCDNMSTKGYENMKLSSLCKYNKITIQCHNNPDADTIASGYAAYKFFDSKGIKTRLIYCGNEINKPNLKMMVNSLEIPIERLEDVDTRLDGLLLLVDCQYGESNVTKLCADEVAVIDHHNYKADLSEIEYVDIRPQMGSCSTIMWLLLKNEGVLDKRDVSLETALYYGLMTDTENFVEAHHPRDLDMRDELYYDKMMISSFVNSNISLRELEIAAISLIRNNYNFKYRYSVAKADPCDANILGMIIDIIKTVDGIDTCVIFNDAGNGYKFSVRSCTSSVKANELAVYLAKGMGNAGGHIDKAGGFCDKEAFYSLNGNLEFETYINSKLAAYFDSVEVIDSNSYEMDLSETSVYSKMGIVMEYVDPETIVPLGTDIIIRTLEGDINLKVDGTFNIMIGVLGEVYPIKKEVFNRFYETNIEGECDRVHEYEPVLHDYRSGKKWKLHEDAKLCRVYANSRIYAKKLDHYVKVFTKWDKESYMSGTPGDYLACPEDDVKDVYVIKENIFNKTYENVVDKVN